MRTRNLIALGTLAIFSLGSLAVVNEKPRELIYKNRSLIEWLEQAEYPPISCGAPAERNPLEEATAAVRAIGTNGVPTLLALVEARDSRFRIVIDDLMRKQSIVRIRPSSDELNKYGLRGFRILSTNAHAAIPSLLVDLRSEDPRLRKRASDALEFVGHRSK